METFPDILRARLEDRAELLEAARLRYRALRLMLRGFFWRDTLRGNLELLREVAHVQRDVDVTLLSVSRRASAEDWPPDSSSMLLVMDVLESRDALAKWVARRLRSTDKPAFLGDALLRLEEELLKEGLLFGRHWWIQTVELLPRNLPELRAAHAAAEIFEQVFKRPIVGGTLPFNTEEAEAVRRALPLAHMAMDTLWSRVRRFDPSGRLEDCLEKRSRRVPGRSPRSGPELFLHANFWFDLASSRLSALLDARLSPVSPREEEWPELLGWLVERETSLEARLNASEVLSAGRAGLIEAAAELAALSSPRPAGNSSEDGAWLRLAHAAQRAKGEQGADMERLCDALRLFIRLRGRPETPARLFFAAERSFARFTPPSAAEEEADLPGLVQLARLAVRVASSASRRS